MPNSTLQRRTFLKTAVAGLSVAQISKLAAAGDMPMRTLGRTGLRVSHFCLGGFHMRKNGEENAVKMIQRAMDLGVNFFDSARKYHDGASDLAYGKALGGESSKRGQVLLMSKAHFRTAAAAMYQLEQTLRDMKTDYLDLWQCHEVSRPDEVAQIFGPGGSLEAFVKAKEQGKVRHIGFTGHHNPEVHLALLRGFDGWETIQHPVNLIDQRSAEPILIRACRPNWISRPETDSTTKRLVSRSSRMRPRSTTKPNSSTIARQATIPSSSPATAKMKSEWASGSCDFTVPSPGPRPNSPPLRKASIERSIW